MAKVKQVRSGVIKGSNSNHHWPVEFELENDVIWIDQYNDKGLEPEHLTDRVLLTKEQFDALVKFVEFKC